jgi:hypothetical protein
MTRTVRSVTVPDTPAEPDDTVPGDVNEAGRVPLATPAPKIVTLEAVVSFNEHLVGDRWDCPLDERTLALVDRGWVDVVGVDGFVLPAPL